MRYRTPEDRGPRRPMRDDHDDERLDRGERGERDDQARYGESRFSESRQGRADDRYEDDRGPARPRAYPWRSEDEPERERWSGEPRWTERPRGEPGHGERAWGYGGYGGYGASGGPIVWRAPRGRTGRGPKGYTRSDERILEDVCDRIGLELDASDVEVRVSNGEVTLFGSVADRETKYEMEEIVDWVGGVKQVHNQIMVRRVYQGDERLPSDLSSRRRGPQH